MSVPTVHKAKHPIPSLLDPTGTVNLGDPAETQAAIEAILTGLYADAFDARLLKDAMRDLVDAYRGQYPGLLRSDTLYHDLRHALETGLTVARLLDGYAKAQPPAEVEVDAHDGLLCVLLGLYHDIGLLRTTEEAGLSGPALIPRHEERGVEFVRSYLAQRMDGSRAGMARLIMATNFVFTPPDGWTPLERLLASFVGTADLLSQFSDRCYLEKCRDFLFDEFAACGMAGSPDSPYPDREALLSKTPGFFENVIFGRLEHLFGGVYRLLRFHTGTGNPWHDAIRRNLEFLADILAAKDFSRLRRKPRTVH